MEVCIGSRSADDNMLIKASTGDDSPWTEEKRQALEAEKKAVEAELQEHLADQDVTALRRRTVSPPNFLFVSQGLSRHPLVRLLFHHSISCLLNALHPQKFKARPAIFSGHAKYFHAFAQKKYVWLSGCLPKAVNPSLHKSGFPFSQ